MSRNRKRVKARKRKNQKPLQEQTGEEAMAQQPTPDYIGRQPQQGTRVTEEALRRSEEERLAANQAPIGERDFSKPIEANTSSFVPETSVALSRDELVTASEQHIAQHGLPEGYRDPQNDFREVGPGGAPAAAPQVPVQSPPPAYTPPSYEDVSDSTLLLLEQELGIFGERLHEATFELGNTKVDFQFRRSSYDDYFWAGGVIERRIIDQEFGSLTSTQVSQLIDHLAASRCVVRIQGKLPVELFKMVPALKQLAPTWDGDYKAIPQVFATQATVKLFDWLRTKMHPGLIAFIADEVEKIENKEEVAQKKAATENPS